MNPVATATIPVTMQPGPILVRFSVSQYHDMIRTGILAEDQAIELLDGWVVEKMPKNPRHRAATRLVEDALAAQIPDGWYVDSQEPITLVNSKPEPDVVVVRGTTRDYLARHPGPTDVGLVVEVSDTSPEQDRILKLRLYAESGIPWYWIVNLADSEVEVYSQPSGRRYRQRETCGPEDVARFVLKGREVGSLAVADLLPVT